MSSTPLVTVIVPSYNHKKYILECLDAIKDQTYSNIQWIVVDDGSKDGSQELLKEKQSYYGYELFLQDNKGLSATLTDMMKNHAKGKYIEACASDDAWLPEKTQKQVDYMEAHPNCAMCFGRTYRMDANSTIYGDDNYNIKNYCGGRIFNDIITQKFHPPVNYMWRAEVLASIGFFPQGVVAEDFYINCKIAYDYEIGYIPEFMGKYRITPSEGRRDPSSLLKSHEETILLYKNTTIFPKAIRLQYIRTFCRLALYKKYKRLAFRYMIKSLPLFYNKLFIIGVSNFLFKWKKC